VLVEGLWATGNGILSTQVLQEFCATARRKISKPLSLDDTHRVIREYLAWEVVVNTPASVLDALRMEARYKVSFWDALILTAAGHAGAETVYSEDLSHGQRYGSVRVENPFIA
jgi:predicted nucleic acid-binding protein